MYKRVALHILTLGYEVYHRRPHVMFHLQGIWREIAGI